ncbi:MAG: ABC transporter ATP-binding protein, partial [Duncaniella sp.]|nr:ABC transporter ATP-binding protein [Duncaniella sp.]
IIVSHDREFLDGLVEKVYEFGGGQVRECLGGIYEFLEKKKLASLAELERSVPAARNETTTKNATTKNATDAVSPREQRKLSYAEQREREKFIRKARKKVEEAEAEVNRLEHEIAEIEEQISSGSTQSGIYERHAETTRRLENAMSVWELATIEYEDLERTN